MKESIKWNVKISGDHGKCTKLSQFAEIGKLRLYVLPLFSLDFIVS